MKTGIFWRICFITHRFFGERFCFSAQIYYICNMNTRIVILMDGERRVVGAYTSVKKLSEFIGRKKYSYVRKLVRDDEEVRYKGWIIFRTKIL